MSEREERNAGPVLDELQDELGRELMRVAEADDLPRRLPSLRRVAPVLGALALVGGGAGVAIAATSAGDEPEARITPVVTAVVTPDGKVLTFRCEAASEWFMAAIADGPEEFNSSDAAFPDLPEGICDGQPPLPGSSDREIGGGGESGDLDDTDGVAP